VQPVTNYARILLPDGTVATGALSEEGSVDAGGVNHEPGSFTFLPPVVPTKLVCAGFNYRAHANEMAEAVPDAPLIFFKPPSAVVGHEATITRPPSVVSRMDYEGELVVVIGRRARDVPAADALSYVEGLTIGNDVTARQFQVAGAQWTRAKGYDTFAPIGPAVWRTTEWAGRALETRLNGKVVQSATTDRLIFDVPTLIAWISSIMTLEQGDLIMTGTPSGVGPMEDGDVVEIAIEGLGCLRNTVGATQPVLVAREPVGASE